DTIPGLVDHWSPRSNTLLENIHRTGELVSKNEIGTCWGQGGVVRVGDAQEPGWTPFQGYLTTGHHDQTPCWRISTARENLSQKMKLGHVGDRVVWVPFRSPDQNAGYSTR